MNAFETYTKTATEPTELNENLIRLNLGCGDKILSGYINVDVVESRGGKKPDILCDLHNLKIFPDNYADEILSVHVIEHFWQWEVSDILKEWIRVLKPGGKMIIECPNLISAAEEFLKNPDLSAQGGRDGQRSMWVFYGDPAWKDPYMIHRWGYTPNTLTKLMHDCGLEKIKQEPAQFKLKEPRDMRITGFKKSIYRTECAGLDFKESINDIKSLHQKYASSRPFPHVIFDNFLNNELISKVQFEINNFQDWDGEKNFYGSKEERHCGSINKIPPTSRALIQELNGPDFLKFLEDLTGIDNLIPDPYLLGGGYQSIGTGGFLKIHADFNWHQKLQAHRRINLLLYLNEGWNKDWGGCLELWDSKMQNCELKIPPISNRLVIFNTTDISFHGHPDALECPLSIRRNSIALYYYTTTKPETEIIKEKVQ